MDIIINDYSLMGQFKSVDDFSEYAFRELKPLLELFEKFNFVIYKDYSSFSCKVTQDKNLHDVFCIFNDPSITRIKSLLSNLINDDPFWSDSPKTDINDYYESEYINKIPNCLTEAYERNGMLLSFKNNKFNCNKVTIIKNGNKVPILNAFEKINCLENLLENNVIDLVYFLENIEAPIKMKFAKSNNKYYMLEAMDSSLTIKDINTIKDDLLSMLNNRHTNKSSRFSKPMKAEIYFEFRTSISDGKEFRLFYIYANSEIVFLNSCIKKSNLTPSNEKEIARILAKQYIK